MLILITGLLLVGEVISQEVDPNSIRALSFNIPLIDELKGLLNDPGLVDINICKLTEENWASLKQFNIRLMVDTKGVNYKTGTFNFSLFDVPNLPKAHREQFEAAQCDEEYNMQPDMDSKIDYVGKGFLLRQGNCPGVTPKEVACKEYKDDGDSDEDHHHHHHDDDDDDDDHDDDDDDRSKKHAKSKSAKLERKIRSMINRFA